MASQLPMKTGTAEEESALEYQNGGNDVKTPSQKRVSAWWGTIACGAGLFSDGYLNASIGPVGTILGTIYGAEYKKSPRITTLTAIAFAGTIVGQIGFGFTSDHWSRTGSLMVSTVILIVFAALSAGAYSGGTFEGMLTALIAYRFFVGIGIGGEYPAGSVGAAEHSGGLKKGQRNRWFIIFTNVMIDLGFVLAYLVSMIVVLACTENHLRAAWRIILGIGAIPPFVLFFLRLKIQEPEPYKTEQMNFTQTPWWLAIKFYWWRLLLVSIIWFIYDLCSYSFGLFSTLLVNSLFASSGGNSSSLWQNIGWGCLINFFYLPGAILGSFVSDWIGAKYTLIVGTALQAVIGFAIAAQIDWFYQSQHVAGFCIVYGLFLGFGELGPGDNIGLLASKTSATAIRGKYYGIAAAIGKVGAFAGQYVFARLDAIAGDNTLQGTQNQFWLGGSLVLFSCFLALFLPNISQDVVAEEDTRFRNYLAANGYNTAQLGIQGHHIHGGENIHTGGNVQIESETRKAEL